MCDTQGHAQRSKILVKLASGYCFSKQGHTSRHIQRCTGSLQAHIQVTAQPCLLSQLLLCHVHFGGLQALQLLQHSLPRLCQFHQTLQTWQTGYSKTQLRKMANRLQPDPVAKHGKQVTARPSCKRWQTGYSKSQLQNMANRLQQVPVAKHGKQVTARPSCKTWQPGYSKTKLQNMANRLQQDPVAQHQVTAATVMHLSHYHGNIAGVQLLLQMQRPEHLPALRLVPKSADLSA